MNSKDKVLGVLGGLGPMSSVYFYELVTENTMVEKDQDHIDMIISSKATTPDRTAYILGDSKENPLPVMESEAAKLVSCGAEIIALTCNTAHYFYENLQASINVPILNIGALAVDFIKENGVKKVGLMATDGTVKCGIYQSACKDKNIECITPTGDSQKKVMDIIYNQIKKGKQADMEEFISVCDELRQNGAEMLILGCTELSLIKRTERLSNEFIDPLEVLAKASVVACGHQLSDPSETENYYAII